MLLYFERSKRNDKLMHKQFDLPIMFLDESKERLKEGLYFVEIKKEDKQKKKIIIKSYKKFNAIKLDYKQYENKLIKFILLLHQDGIENVYINNLLSSTNVSIIDDIAIAIDDELIIYNDGTKFDIIRIYSNIYNDNTVYDIIDSFNPCKEPLAELFPVLNLDAVTITYEYENALQSFNISRGITFIAPLNLSTVILSPFLLEKCLRNNITIKEDWKKNGYKYCHKDVQLVALIQKEIMSRKEFDDSIYPQDIIDAIVEYELDTYKVLDILYAYKETRDR